MGGKGKAPPAPDYSAVAAASEKNAEWGYKSAELSRDVAMENLAWAKEEYANNRELLDRVLNTQLPIMEREAAEGAKLRERYNTVFQPIEDQLVKEANEYASGSRSDYDAGRAMGAVGQSFDAARSNALARMESYGVDPSQTRAGALDAGIRVQEAAAKAAAGTQSRLNTENTGRALRGEAINIGRGLPGNIAGAYGTAMAAGNSGLGGANALYNSGNAAMNNSSWMNAGTGAMGASNSALGNWSNTIGKSYEGANAAYNAKNEQSGKMGSAIGSIAGMAIGSFAGPGGAMLGSALGGAAGGAMAAQGGRMPDDPADPAGKGDTLDVKLSGGEHVIPTSAVRRLGSDHFDKLIAKYGDPEDSKAAQERLQSGKPGGEKVTASALRAQREHSTASALRAVA